METSRELTDAIVSIFEENRSEANRERMEAYMKNHFSFYGIKAPEQKKLLTPILKEYSTITEQERFETARLLFQQPARECHYAALTLLEKGMKQMPEYAIDVYKELLVTHSWWDTVDMIAAKLCGRYLFTYPSMLEPVTKEWRLSENLWVRRSSVLHQLKYKEQTQEELLFDTVRTLKDEREFFIEKAIGWALREYSKTNPDAVQTFLATNDVRPLSRREGLKWVKTKGLLRI